ncbi:hypothetical protein [Aquimarina sp. RZ0]|uniref:hypothetical protein n=1 Tax=Aquimarina sp. RZ0 TaxID=2607730 RepID=UPI0011F0E110|nr:hypothetical protein [Aquimarina sp. RZ0]KAA1246466.1 hypothetical protein F0000_07615 [Aquimarina sp. RZ0]
MKKRSMYCIIVFILLLGFISCDENEEFETCLNVSISINNTPGSEVYRFYAQLDKEEEVRLSWSIDGEEVTIRSLNDIINQSLDYRFEEGSHMICVKAASDTCLIEVCEEIEVIIDELNPCPDLFFDAHIQERPSQYKLIANFRGIEEIPFEWFINEELVENTNNDNYLFWEFDEVGRYEVCVKAETEECANGVFYCKVIEVEAVSDRCPEISFDKEREPDAIGSYVFEAVIEEIDEVNEVQWYVNGDLVENTTDEQEGIRLFTYQFTRGIYEVCLKVFTSDCQDGVVYCKEIKVDDDVCPELYFEIEQDDTNPAYYFQVAFEGADVLEWLGWYINGDFVEDSNQGDNNRFYYQFAPGRYEVCLKTETPECPEGISYCKIIEIEAPAITCPDLYFDIEQEGDSSGYNFWTNVDGLNGVTYEWLINGEVVDREIVDSSDRDNYLYHQFEEGTYEICIATETQNCPNGILFCKTLVIE